MVHEWSGNVSAISAPSVRFSCGCFYSSHIFQWLPIYCLLIFSIFLSCPFLFFPSSFSYRNLYFLSLDLFPLQFNFLLFLAWKYLLEIPFWSNITVISSFWKWGECHTNFALHADSVRKLLVKIKPTFGLSAPSPWISLRLQWRGSVSHYKRNGFEIPRVRDKHWLSAM
jgi:hypothetical protein